MLRSPVLVVARRAAVAAPVAPMGCRTMARARPRVTVVRKAHDGLPHKEAVKGGYARNYLVPQQIAIYGTKAVLAQLEKDTTAKASTTGPKKKIVERVSMDQKRAAFLSWAGNAISLQFKRAPLDSKHFFGSIDVQNVTGRIFAKTKVNIIGELGARVTLPDTKTFGFSSGTIHVPAAGLDTSSVDIQLIVEVVPRVYKTKDAHVASAADPTAAKPTATAAPAPATATTTTTAPAAPTPGSTEAPAKAAKPSKAQKKDGQTPPKGTTANQQ